MNEILGLNTTETFFLMCYLKLIELVFTELLFLRLHHKE